MPRTILAEPKVLSYLQAECEKDTFLYGIILGQRSSQGDYVFHLAPSPIIAGNDTGTYSYEGYTSTADNKSIEKVDKKEVHLQASLVTSMLSGGLNALGMFVVTSANIFSSSIINKMKPFFSQPINKEEASTFDLLFHFNPETQRFACRSIEDDGYFYEATWKFAKKPFNWIQLDCGFKGNLIPPCLFDLGDGTDAATQIKCGYQSFKNVLGRCVFRINGSFRKSHELVSACRKVTAETDKNKEEKENEVPFKVDAFLKLPSKRDKNISDGEVRVLQPGGTVLTFQGILRSRVFLHEGTTVGEMTEAIRTDFLRTCFNRIELYTADQRSGIKASNGRELHCLPRRVLYQMSPSCPLSVSDHLDPDEGENVILTSVQEHLGIKGNPAFVNTSFERQFSECLSLQPPSNRNRCRFNRGTHSSAPQ